MTSNETRNESQGDRRPDLDTLYDPPVQRIQKAVLDRLIGCHIEYLKAATFFCLATGSEHGLDASPRGGPPGFVRVLDSRTVAYADWPGNNRIESLRNLESDGRLGLMFLFPGLDIFMRINGRGRISTEPSLLAALTEGERIPKTATVVTIDEVLMHCGKAINRAKLWQDDSRISPHALPTVGQMLAELTMLDDAQAGMTDEQIEQVNAHYQHGMHNDLY
ncbi:MSMEG_1061 family FMN-dependent PPOX-type flavoprotein [Burkholderia plantarii]|uniref:MSMEG_1061 family FMN-dependent PPOX-type flavoprotein n=1 Tax=Burkholderia plantarii TaxID=41899 RepID=UPI0006D8BFCF|nr:MSMEG_1061 family FMN-dependent PPOX-type flavoprotein [Burkholderia plantarii]ALK33666.1 pyridoxamine 5'-phosphate oxidase family protein [Burkholderia plantarii]WLE62694.1 pyridoxamine 5'-phosphate oxidase family protein [Burkholderia plantarii]GLZ16835.1 pyridoxamine 5'-phosphate oxidase [Burkholderia plantarii]